MAEEDGVDLGDGVNVAVENSNKPRGSTDKHTMWSASSSGRLQVVGVEGGVSSGGEDQGALWVDNNLLPLLRIRFPPGRAGHVGHHGQVGSLTWSLWEVFMALLHHLV